MATNTQPQQAAGGSNPAAQPLFAEDTVEVAVAGKRVLGVVARTWYDLDEEVVWEDIDEAVAGAVATPEDLAAFQETGQAPRHFVLFTPSTPGEPPMLLHESECHLLDRSFEFSDAVKRSADSAQSGTVISVRTTCTVRPAYFDPSHPDRWPPDNPVESVPGSELAFASEWNEGDFIIYKNCWMGIVEDVIEDVWVKLADDSVVIVDDPALLRLPVPQDIGERNFQLVADPSARGSSNGDGSIDIPGQVPGAMSGDMGEELPVFAPGQAVVTTKANLRRGKWVFGAYNASMPPLGVVVHVKPISLAINWICQNMMVRGKFVPVPPPPPEIDVEEELENLRCFRKSSGGLKEVDGTPYHDLLMCSGGAELQVGDRVRFRDIDAALRKYPGKVMKIAKRDVLGFDVNVYVVVETKTRVRVLWQDLTETMEDSSSLIPYINIDDHEVWPGEIVIIKPETAAATSSAPNNGTVIPTMTRGMWEALKTVTASPLHVDPEETPEFLRPSKVGVVQTADPAGRVAQVRWFVNPKVEVAASIMIPGSKTGELALEPEDVSFYEMVAHQAVGMRRGDFVLITPESVQDESQPSPIQSTPPTAVPTPDGSAQSQEYQVSQLVENLRGMVDAGLLANLSAALSNHSHPQFQAVSRMLNQFPGLLPGGHHTPPQILSATSSEVYANEPQDWIGEVVDLGLDGLVTVRLGALDTPTDIRVPVERLHVIFNDEMDFGESDDEDGSDSEPEIEVIEEVISYEGGERLDNGQEEDWTTDDEDVDMTGEGEPTAPTTPTTNPQAEPVPRISPPIPEDIPAPEAVSLPDNSSAPPRFEVLDADIPVDHAFATHMSVQISAALSKRIVREHKILAASLPEGIFVRTWERRLDLMRVLIVGPLNTPYELAPFVFDFHFPPNFPNEPPVGYFHSWTNGIGRVNPNLYEDGKICLSLLGTWHAERHGEGWSASGSSVLQLLVSLMGLVLVREPWYNEAGFGVYQGSAESSLNSQLYSEKAFILARGFVRHVLERPVRGLEDVIDWLYLPHNSGPELLKTVVDKAHAAVERSEKDGSEGLTMQQTSDGVGRVSKGALVLLKRNLKVLEELLVKNDAMDVD